MDTGAAAFSLPIFRPALLSFTWQTPPALPSESLLFDNAALHLLPAAKHRFFPFQNTRLQSPPTHFPSHVLSTTCTRERAALFFLSFSSLLFITHSLSFSLVLPLHLPLRVDLLVAFMTGTHLPAVCRLHKGTLPFCRAYLGGSNVHGDRELATRFASSIPLSSSLSTSARIDPQTTRSLYREKSRGEFERREIKRLDRGRNKRAFYRRGD